LGSVKVDIGAEFAFPCGSDTEEFVRTCGSELLPYPRFSLIPCVRSDNEESPSSTGAAFFTHDSKTWHDLMCAAPVQLRASEIFRKLLNLDEKKIPEGLLLRKYLKNLDDDDNDSKDLLETELASNSCAPVGSLLLRHAIVVARELQVGSIMRMFLSE
jgi:hypothetical protein